MQVIRLFILVAALFTLGSAFGQQVIPRFFFYNEDGNPRTDFGNSILGYDEGFCGSGDVHIQLFTCDDDVTSAYTIDHIAWDMGAGGPLLTTTVPEIHYTYAQTGTYFITAQVFFEMGGDSYVSYAVSGVLGNNLPHDICLATPASGSPGMGAPVLVYGFSLDMTPNSGTLTTDSLITILSNYTGEMHEESLTDFIVYLDGQIVQSTNSLPASGGALLTARTYRAGQHVVELYARPKTGRLCMLSAVISFEVDTVICNSCFTFKPEVGKRYWASAWVKENTVNQVMTYSNQVGMRIECTGNGQIFNFYPTGDIIDGWQRIAGDFVIPSGTTSLSINLMNNNSAITANFDDVRIHPFNGSMKSYVYDPGTFWLTAELDDNNYATFYEYDQEGQLIRIKKETASGIQTIQESRSSNPKQ